MPSRSSWIYGGHLGVVEVSLKASKSSRVHGGHLGVVEDSLKPPRSPWIHGGHLGVVEVSLRATKSSRVHGGHLGEVEVSLKASRSSWIHGMVVLESYRDLCLFMPKYAKLQRKGFCLASFPFKVRNIFSFRMRILPAYI